MKNILEVKTEYGEIIKIEILLNFRIEELDKDYVVYTLNDDNVSEYVHVCISEINTNGEKPVIVSIPDKDAEKVLLFYESIKKTI